VNNQTLHHPSPTTTIKPTNSLQLVLVPTVFDNLDVVYIAKQHQAQSPLLSCIKYSPKILQTSN